MNNLIYNGHSLNDLGFAIKEKPFYKVAARNMEFNSVNGGDGDVIIDNGNYNNVELEYQINSLPWLFPSSDSQINLHKFIDSFYNSDGTYKVLKDTYNPGYFTYAICINPSDIQPIGNKNFNTVLKFNRKPYWYSESGQEKITIKSHKSVLLNPEQYISNPYIKIIGSGAFTLRVNDTEIYVSKCNGYIEIDCEKYNVKKGTVDKNDVVEGDYLPHFDVGENVITLTPDVADNSFKMEITPNWRRL